MEFKPPPAIIVADECWAFSRGISTILDSVDLLTEARVNSIADCIQTTEQLSNPGDSLVICGPHLPERPLFDFFRWLRCEKPDVKSILISTQAADRNFYLDVAANHVRACLPHGLQCEQIAQAIQDVLSGRVLFSTEELEQAFRPTAITDAERQVLQLMADGLSYGKIANKLVLSLNTVRNHANNIQAKLNVHDRDAAVARAYRRGLLAVVGDIPGT